MKQILVFAITTFYIATGYSQVFGNLIERAVQLTVLIQIDKTSSASGIIVIDSSNNLLLITAKHTFYDPNTNFTILNGKIATISLYTKDFRKDDATYIFLNIPYIANNKLLICDSIHDICIVKLAKAELSGAIKYNEGIFREGKNASYVHDHFENIIMSKKDIFLGEDVFITGYPTSIGLQQIPQFDYYRPLLKRGAIASVSEDLDNIIIDCPVFHGNSGGPVFLERKGFNSYSLKLIGIVSQFIPLLNSTLSGKDKTLENSSYGVIVPIEYAQKLIYKK